MFKMIFCLHGQLVKPASGLLQISRFLTDDCGHFFRCYYSTLFEQKLYPLNNISCYKVERRNDQQKLGIVSIKSC